MYKNYYKEYYLKNIEKLQKQIKIYRDGHKSETKNYQEIYRGSHKEETRVYQKNYRLTHKENKKKYIIENEEKLKKYYRNYNKEYYLKNREKLIEQKKEYNKIPKNKLVKNLRNRIIKVLQGINKSKSTMKLVGCSIENLRLHLQSQFKRGMSFSNYGQWHVDHIIPCASFDLSKPSEQKKCFHYTNLQPLWAKENQSKGDR